MCFWFLFNILFILACFDVLASSSVSCLFLSLLQADQNPQIIAAHKGGRDCWVRAQVCRRNLTKSAKLEPLLSMSSKSVFYSLIMIKQVKSSRQISRCQRVNPYKPIDINESILSNRSMDFHPMFCFPIIHHNSIFSTHVRRDLLFK